MDFLSKRNPISFTLLQIVSIFILTSLFSSILWNFSWLILVIRSLQIVSIIGLLLRARWAWYSTFVIFGIIDPIFIGVQFFFSSQATSFNILSLFTFLLLMFINGTLFVNLLMVVLLLINRKFYLSLSANKENSSKFLDINQQDNLFKANLSLSQTFYITLRIFAGIIFIATASIFMLGLGLANAFGGGIDLTFGNIILLVFFILIIFTSFGVMLVWKWAWFSAIFLSLLGIIINGNDFIQRHVIRNDTEDPLSNLGLLFVSGIMFLLLLLSRKLYFNHK